MKYFHHHGLSCSIEKQLSAFVLQVSFHCPPGETTLLVGPSGSGKSTLLRCLAGLESADTGYIQFEEECWYNQSNHKSLSPQCRQIGFLAQDYPLFPHMSGLENVMFAAKSKSKAHQFLDILKISHLADKKPHQLSGGERQRFALAQTFARCPRALLLDEPFSALDLENKRILQNLVTTIQHSENLPVIQITHDLHDPLLQSAHVVAINQGTVDPLWLPTQYAEFERYRAIFPINHFKQKSPVEESA
ncbi:sulfate/molybdate ABC transporter ATP-binding protein [Desulfogranum japonicum]|uniref:sulfate/molybdate ABC transporter ATP-binding protein n=1 Tax=Desulfogranum japonicum TaxID=231447 RepID=UPI000401909E|nr:ATP-binding cassette domain-containing protein [Desulfogranum japonicum]